ncbi:MAG: HU family DNA-binding protein [Bacteroidia bacterium]|nr:HU family DNA-binding protein [Bacteroidia bacterium]MDW8236369.1 HU family DNA-binding protein [Bacteroidia bacterium]
MKRRTLTQEISERTGLSQTDAAACLNAAIEVIRESLLRGEPITLRGFGTFTLKYQRARKGRLLDKGVSITIPPRLRVRFSPSPKLQNRLQNDKELLRRFEPK